MTTTEAIFMRVRDVKWRTALVCFLILTPDVTFRWHCSAKNSDAIQNELSISKLKPFLNVLEDNTMKIEIWL